MQTGVLSEGACDLSDFVGIFELSTEIMCSET